MILTGDNEDNVLISGLAADIVIGGRGDDVIYGGDAEDTSSEGAAVAHLSAAVKFLYSEANVKKWLESPSKAYIQSDFVFQDDLPSDVLVGVDFEWFEGTENPQHVSGGDWMALAGVTRDGILRFPYGTQESHDNGTPTGTINWETIDLGVQLSPQENYQIRLEADFSNRRFVSFEIIGPDVDVKVDLSNYLLDYPNLIPIDKPAVTNYVFTFRAETFGGRLDDADTSVYFDNVHAGVMNDGVYSEILSDGIEQQQQISNLPIEDFFNIQRNNIEEGVWYNERFGADVSIVDGVIKSVTNLLEANADKDKGDILSGGDGNDTIYGEYGNDYIFGGNDDDLLFGGSGDDKLYGQLGNDIIYGGWGFDEIRGDDGADILSGGGGNDKIYGGLGDDTLTGGIGNDILKGDEGHDYIIGGDGNDGIFGGYGNDIIFGGSDIDWILGNGGDDIIFGGDELDLISGGGGNDWLYGENGDDYISGGEGNDLITGGAGEDVFVFRSQGLNNADLITDFNLAEDSLYISDIVSSFDPLTDVITDFIMGQTFGTNDMYVVVDSDGSGTNEDWQLIATLEGYAANSVENESLDVQALYDNGQIII